MSPRRMIALVVLAALYPISLTAQSVSPHGGTHSVAPNTTGTVAPFTVSNNTDLTETYWLSCQFTGAVTSCQSAGNVTVEAWGSAQVDVTYSVGSPGTGTVELTADGSNWDTGWYDVTVPGPARYSPTIDLTPHNGENRSMALCAAACFDATASYVTPAYVSMDTPRSLTLLYRSAQAMPWATVQVDATDTSEDPAAALSIRLRRPDGTWVQFRDGTSEVFFDRAAGMTRLAAQFDATALATGVHKYTLVARSHWSNETREASTPINVLVVNEGLNAWAPAPGWSIAGLQKMIRYGAESIVITEGDGSILRFVQNSCASYVCTYDSPRADFTSVTRFTLDNTVQRKYPDGTTLKFTSGGDLAYSEDRFGNRTNYSYGLNRRLTQVTDPASKVIALGYNAGGKLASITDPGGRVTRVEYDAAGNVQRIVRPDGVAAMALSWGYWGGPYRFFGYTDAVGGQWSYDYDAFGKLSSVTLPQVAINGVSERPVAASASLESRMLSAAATSYTSRAAARISANLRATTTNPRGYSTAYQLDRFGAPLRIEEPLGRTTVIARNVDAQPWEVTPPFGWPVSYSWERQNLRAVYGGNRPYISYEYETTYNQVTRVSGDTPTIRNYWSGGKLDSTWTGSDSTRPSRFTYDVRGRIKTSGDPRTHGTTYYYATSGWQNTDSVKAGSRRTAYAYDAWGRATAVTNPMNQTSRTVMDSLNRVRMSVGPMADTTRFAYNATFLTSVTDARGQVYGYTPNLLGWVEMETDPRGWSHWYRYDRNGNVTRATNRRSQDIVLAYDEFDQVVSRMADGATATFRTDPLGRFTATSNGESTDTLWLDGDGRDSTAVTIRGGNAYRLTPTYERRGVRTQVEMSGPGWTSAVGYRYNAHLGLDTLIDVAGGRTPITYNVDRQPTGWTLPTGLSIAGGYSSHHATAKVRYPNNGTVDAAIGVNYGYDDLSRVRQRLNFDQTRGRTYGRDPLGRLTHDSIFHYEPGTQKCTPIYENNQITSEEEPIGYDCTTAQNRISDGIRVYAYDLIGNRTDLGAVVEAGNRLTSFDGLTLEYDLDGNIVRKVRAGVSEQILAWNSLGQLVSATTNGSTTTFGYDGFGRRVRKSGPLETKYYIHDGDDLFAELDGSYALQAEYTYYPGVDRPHSVRRGGAMYYYATDHPGNVVGVIDASGTLRNEYRYEAFGLREYRSETVPNALGYAARELDSETGLYFNRARYYDPELGRFISEDPIGLSGGMNLYVYAGNDPVSYTDPTGLCTAEDPDRVLISRNEEGDFVRQAYCLDKWGRWAPVGPMQITANPLNTAGVSGVRRNTPSRGPPGGGRWVDGEVFRRFGPDGRAIDEYNRPTHHKDLGSGHKHPWDWNKIPHRQRYEALQPTDRPLLLHAFQELLKILATRPVMPLILVPRHPCALRYSGGGYAAPGTPCGTPGA